MKKSRDLLINVPPTSAPRTIQKLSISAWQYASNAIEGSRPLARRHVQRRPLRDAPCGPSRPNPIARRQAQGFSKCVTEAHQGCRRKLSVRSDYRKSACSVFCDVCFALQNGLKSGIARCMKSADIVAKVPKRAAANFPQKNETGDIRRSIGLQTRYQNGM
jgi:hypothetical protein